MAVSPQPNPLVLPLWAAGPAGGGGGHRPAHHSCKLKGFCCSQGFLQRWFLESQAQGHLTGHRCLITPESQLQMSTLTRGQRGEQMVRKLLLWRPWWFPKVKQQAAFMYKWCLPYGEYDWNFKQKIETITVRQNRTKAIKSKVEFYVKDQRQFYINISDPKNGSQVHQRAVFVSPRHKSH